MDQSDEAACPSVHSCDHDDLHIPKQYVDDLIPDCVDSSDELKLTDILINFHTLPYSVKSGSKSPCVINSQLPCTFGHPKCYDISNTCLMTHDINHQLRFCRNGAHLRNCSEWICQNSFKCPNSFCIPYHYVCDGVKHCADGEDENVCVENKLVCPGMLQCRGGSCVHSGKVCDGVIHCPLGDDERGCHSTCPEGCVCFGPVLDCSNRTTHQIRLPDVDSVSYQIIALDLSGNNYRDLSNLLWNERLRDLKYLDVSFNKISTFTFGYLHKLLYLDISHNDIIILPYLLFTSLNKLTGLVIEQNKLQFLEESAFHGLEAISKLDLSNQEIHSIHDKSFHGLTRVTHLSLANNSLTHFQAAWFKYLPNLYFLDLRGNHMQSVTPETLQYWQSIGVLLSDESNFCCAAVTFTMCNNITDPADRTEFSCSPLFPDIRFNIVAWVLGLFGIVSNAVTIILRWKEGMKKLQTMLITNMALSDLMYSICLLVLTSTDNYYSKLYPFMDKAWRNHITCKLVSIFTTLSLEMSLLLSLVIAGDRCFGLTRDFAVHTSSERYRLNNYVKMPCAWVLVLLLAFIPFFFDESLQTSTLPNKTCIMIYLTPYFKSLWIYTLCVFVCLNITCVILMTCIYIRMRIVLGRTNNLLGKAASSRRKNQMRKITARITLIITANLHPWFLVLIAVIVGQFLTDFETRFHDNLLTLLVIVVFSVNPCLSPWIYTLATKNFRLRRLFFRRDRRFRPKSSAIKQLSARSPDK